MLGVTVAPPLNDLNLWPFRFSTKTVDGERLDDAVKVAVGAGAPSLRQLLCDCGRTWVSVQIQECLVPLVVRLSVAPNSPPAVAPAVFHRVSV